MITHRIVAYLISLAVGYWVLTLAEKEKNHTKTIGWVIAWIIIAVSLIGPVCIAATACCRHCYAPAGGYSAECPWFGGGWHRHGMGPSGMMNGQCPEESQGMMNRKDTMSVPERMEGKGVMKGKGTTEGKEKSE